MLQMLSHNFAQQHLFGVGFRTYDNRLFGRAAGCQEADRQHRSKGEAQHVEQLVGYRESLQERGVCYSQILVKMSFQIRPLKEFLVKPALPPALSRLPELGLNLMWSWHHPQRALFRRLDPVIWKASNHNPVVMLGRVPQETLERASRDPRYLALYRRACETQDAYMSAPGTAESDAALACFQWNTASPAADLLVVRGVLSGRSSKLRA